MCSKLIHNVKVTFFDWNKSHRNKFKNVSETVQKKNITSECRRQYNVKWLTRSSRNVKMRGINLDKRHESFLLYKSRGSYGVHFEKTYILISQQIIKKRAS